MPLVTNNQINALRKNDPQTIVDVRGLLTGIHQVTALMQDLENSLSFSLNTFLDNLRVVAEIYKEATEELKRHIMESFVNTQYIDENLYKSRKYKQFEQLLLTHDAFFIFFTDNEEFFNKTIRYNARHAWTPWGSVDEGYKSLRNLFTDGIFLQKKPALSKQQMKKNLFLLKEVVCNLKLPQEFFHEMKQALLALFKTYKDKNDVQAFVYTYRHLVEQLKPSKEVGECITLNELLVVVSIDWCIGFWNGGFGFVVTDRFSPHDYKDVIVAFQANHYRDLLGDVLVGLVVESVHALVGVIRYQRQLPLKSHVLARIIIEHFKQSLQILKSLSADDKVIVLRCMFEFEKRNIIDTFHDIRAQLSEFIQSLMNNVDLNQLPEQMFLFLLERQEPAFIEKVNADPELKARKDQLLSLHVSNVLTAQLKAQVTELSIEKQQLQQQLAEMAEQMAKLQKENGLLRRESQGTQFIKWDLSSPLHGSRRVENDFDDEKATELTQLMR